MNSHALSHDPRRAVSILSMEYGNACWPAVLEAWEKIVDLQ
jgi:hypothetical protein